MSSPQRISVGELLEAARRRLQRVGPTAARGAQSGGAVLLDIRTESQRARDGAIPGAVFHPRNVVEWRADPESGASDPQLAEAMDRAVIVFCHAGYQSSLVAATLQDLGYPRATDLDGGFEAWRAAGLPVEQLS